MWERLTSVESSSSTSWSWLCGADRLTAALSYVSAISLPATLLWVGTQRVVTSLSQARTLSPTSIAAMAKHRPGPKASVLTRSMAAVQSTKTVLMVTLLAPVEGLGRLADGERLRIEFFFVCLKVEVASRPATR